MINFKNFKKYLIPSGLLILVLIFFANFIAIRSIGNRIEHFFNQEFNTPLTSIKVRCAESIPQGNLVFINYQKQFNDCKIYNTGFGKVDTGNYNYDDYYTVPQLSITYNLLKSRYHLTFKKFGKYSRANIVDNYQFTFENPIEFDIKHDKNKITQIFMENDGDISLTHSSGIQIVDIQNYSNILKYTDDESELGVDLKLKFKFNTLHNFLKFMQENDFKITEDAGSTIAMDFDVETKFERFSKEDQQELKESNPTKYADEKNFFKSLIYDINSIKISNPKYNFETSGVITKTTKPGAPDIDLRISVSDFPLFSDYIVSSIKNTIYNTGQIDIYEQLRPDIAVEAFSKTLQELGIMQNRHLNLHIKSDAIGTFSISGVNFFTFQQKFMTNLFRMRALQFGKDSNTDESNMNSDDGSN